MGIRPIKRTVKANLVSPEIFVFNFDTDAADGYAGTNGVTVTMAIEGVYTCKLPKTWAASQYVSGWVQIAGQEPNNFSAAISEVIETGVVTVTTSNNGSVGLCAAATVNVVLFLQGGI